MKLKVKHGIWGFFMIPIYVALLLGYVYLLVEPFQLKAVETGAHPSFWELALVSLGLGFVAGLTNIISAGLISIYKEAEPETEVDVNWSNLTKGKDYKIWIGIWMFVFLLISIVWLAQL